MFMVSPGVYVKEKDLSDLIPNISTTTSALVRWSKKGNVDEVRQITTPKQFIAEYGEPASYSYFHYSALAFLENGNILNCFRVHNGALHGGVSIIKAAGTGDNAALDVGYSSAAFQTDSATDRLFQVFEKDPGAWGNDLGIRIENIDETELTFEIVVYDTDDDGVSSEVERWEVSRQEKIDGFGRQLYLETKINDFSSYIVVKDNTSEADTVLPKPQATTLDVGGGANGTTPTSGQLITGWDKFTNPDDIDVRVLINGGNTDVEVQQKLKTIAEARRDCIALLDMPYEQLSSATSMKNWRNDTQNFNSSYTALYAPWVKIYDSFNDKIMEIPPSGYVASMIAYNDYVGQPWFAPAGFNRGILNVLGVTNVFTQGERDILYPAQINPLQKFTGEGNVIWGQKTQQTKASALDRVNVRRLLIVLQKAISAQLRYFVFEPNSELVRFRVTAMVEEYLELLGSRGAFQTELGDKGYRVLCNTDNNTPATIDRNELHVDIFIKPTRAAEFIQLQTIITTTGASFNELIARGAMF